MDRSFPKRHWLKDWRIAVPAVLLISAGLLILTFLAYYMTGERFIQKTARVWRGDALTLVMGKGTKMGDGLIIQRPSSQGLAFVKAPPLNLPAERYTDLVWQIDGLQPHTDIRFVWATEAEPQVTQGMIVPRAGEGSGRVKLDGQAQWQGTIISIGLLIQGPFLKPLVVRRLELAPPTLHPGAGMLLTQLWREWTVAEGWRGYSTHFIVGGTLNGLLSPVLAAAAWVGLSILLYVGLILTGQQTWSIKPLAIFLLAGWLALDVRWQMELWQKLVETYQQYAGKHWEHKYHNPEDRQIARFMAQVKKRLPQEPTRIFLVSAEPVARGKTEYTRLRAHYHLLPHNVYSASVHPPSPSHAVTGDYILILSPIEGIHFQRQEKRLRWGNSQQLSVELIYHTSRGGLFKVR